MRLRLFSLGIFSLAMFLLLSGCTSLFGEGDGGRANEWQDIDTSGLEAELTPVAETDGYDLYTEETLYNISLLYPEDWELQEYAGEAAVQIFSPVKDDNDEFRENVNILTEDLQGQDLSHTEYALLNIPNIVDAIPRFDEVSREETVVIGGRPAFRYEYTGEIEGFPIHWVQWYFTDYQTGYVFTYAGSGEGFDEHVSQVEEMARSFRIIGEPI